MSLTGTTLTPVDEIKARLRVSAGKWTKAPIAQIVALTPDASSRRYFRLKLASPHTNGASTAVAMWFDSVACPEAAGGVKVDADEAYVELSRFFRAHKIAVPELYLDDRKDRILLIEDLGDEQLFSLLSAKQKSPEELRTLLFHAIDQLLMIQKLSPEPGFFPFERSFTAELYRREMAEFEEFLFHPKRPAPQAREAVAKCADHLAAELESYPRVLVHRDFHAWNLVVDSADRVRVIDFQDALLATKPYDLVSLLNDRDMDTLLGTPLYKEAIGYFVRKGRFGDDILNVYDRVLLQRDLKVAGRFAKLTQVRGLTQYAAWIPGTLRRLGRTLERLSSQKGDDTELYTKTRAVLETFFSECSAGANDPLRWDDIR